MTQLEEVRRAIDELLLELERQVDQAPEGMRALTLQRHAEILAWRRAQERAEELHEAQLAFWRQFDLRRWWRDR